MHFTWSCFLIAIVFPYLVESVSPPRTPPSSLRHNSPQPMTDFDWDSLGPLQEANLGSSRLDSPSHTTIHQLSPTWSQNMLEITNSPRHEQQSVENTIPTADPEIGVHRKRFRSSGRYKMTEEEKREKNKIRSKLYRSQIKQDPKKYRAQRERSNVRNKIWLSRLPIDKKERLRQIKKENSKRFTIRKKIAKSEGEKGKKKKKEE